LVAQTLQGTVEAEATRDAPEPQPVAVVQPELRVRLRVAGLPELQALVAEAPLQAVLLQDAAAALPPWALEPLEQAM
jgi:hypothetical protein